MQFKNQFALILSATLVFVGCAAGQDDTMQIDEEFEQIETTTEAFTEATCSTTTPDTTRYSWQYPNLCVSGGTQKFTTIETPDNTYNHSDCTRSYVAEFATSPVVRHVSVSGAEAVPTTEAACKMLRVSARVFAYGAGSGGTITTNDLGTVTKSGHWTPSGLIGGTCSIAGADFVVPTSIGGSAINRVRVVAQSYLQLAASKTYRKARINVWDAGACVN